MESTDKHNFFDLNEAMVQGTYENVKKHILVFNEPYQEQAKDFLVKKGGETGEILFGDEKLGEKWAVGLTQDWTLFLS